MSNTDGMNYAPTGKPRPVVKENEFIFSVAALDHGHINGITNGLLEAGATLKYVYSENKEQIDTYVEKYPQAIPVSSLDVILNDPETKLVAAAAITNKRCELGIKVMQSGKDYLTDKAPFTTLEQLEEAKKVIAETGRKYCVYYSEYVHVESTIFAKQLIDEGAIGKVIQVMGLGPHNLKLDQRPDWFFNREEYGGILCDIGSHQIYQFLEFCDIDDATVTSSHVANYNNPDYPELEDFGEAMLVGPNGESNYFRVDWFTPKGLSTWGDGRMIILGTKGYIELRKYTDIARETEKDIVYLVDNKGEHRFSVNGEVGFPFFGKTILDCINRTENAMTQKRALKAAELCILAQNKSINITDK